MRDAEKKTLTDRQLEIALELKGMEVKVDGRLMGRIVVGEGGPEVFVPSHLKTA